MNTKDWEGEFDDKSRNEWHPDVPVNSMLNWEPVKDFIRSLLSSHTQEIREKAKELHRKYMYGETREDVKRCKEPECDHYTLAADDFYHDVLQILESNE